MVGTKHSELLWSQLGLCTVHYSKGMYATGSGKAQVTDVGGG